MVIVVFWARRTSRTFPNLLQLKYFPQELQLLYQNRLPTPLLSEGNTRISSQEER